MKNNPIIAVVIMMIAALKGCTAGGDTDDMSLFTKKYNLYFDSSGFESEKTRYASSDHNEMTGAGYSVIFTFSGIHEGESEMVIEERSPIADNPDHHYMVYVDPDLNVTIEKGEVTEHYATEGS